MLVLRTTWRASVLLGLLALFGSSCSHDSAEDPEVPATPIAGAGLHLFDYDKGSIKCQSYYNGVPVSVECHAVVSVTDATRVDGFKVDIKSHTWNDLSVVNNGQTYAVTDKQVSSDGISAVYTLPPALDPTTNPNPSTITGSLTVARTDAQGNPEQKDVQVVANSEDVAPVTNLTASPMPGGGVRLDWALPTYGAPVNGLKIAMAPNTIPPPDCNSAQYDTGGAVSTYTVWGLTPSAAYSFLVCTYGTTSAMPGVSVTQMAGF